MQPNAFTTRSATQNSETRAETNSINSKSVQLLEGDDMWRLRRRCLPVWRRSCRRCRSQTTPAREEGTWSSPKIQNRFLLCFLFVSILFWMNCSIKAESPNPDTLPMYQFSISVALQISVDGLRSANDFRLAVICLAMKAMMGCISHAKSWCTLQELIGFQGSADPNCLEVLSQDCTIGVWVLGCEMLLQRSQRWMHQGRCQRYSKSSHARDAHVWTLQVTWRGLCPEPQWKSSYNFPMFSWNHAKVHLLQ